MTDQRQRFTREQLYVNDIRGLLLDPKFLRFALRVIDASGMRRSSYGDDGRNLPWWEGRRSFGLEILDTLKSVDANVELALLTEDMKTRQEAPSGRRTDDRRDELSGFAGPGRGADGRARDPIFLDYGDE